MSDVPGINERMSQRPVFVNQVSDMAKAMGLTLNGFRKKLTNRTEFKQSEIAFISDHLNLTLEEREKIFFHR
jgi:hypothetical protein